MLTEETMSPQPQFKEASMLTALYCVTMINQLFQGRARTNTILEIEPPGWKIVCGNA